MVKIITGQEVLNEYEMCSKIFTEVLEEMFSFLT
jgi:hypothetical protein